MQIPTSIAARARASRLSRGQSMASLDSQTLEYSASLVPESVYSAVANIQTYGKA